MAKNVIIIGGGASGLTAAIAAARQGADVTILEHMDRVGKKILSTGNGRCNMTNLSMRAEYYRCSQKTFPMKVLDRFSVWDTLTFFDELGIVTKNRNGYIYPNSDQAASVLDTLRLEAQQIGVQILCGCHISRAGQKKKEGRRQFQVETNQGVFSCSSLILSTGSKAAPATGSDGSGYELARAFGHQIIKPLPALVQLRCEGKQYKQLGGIRCEASLKMMVDGVAVAGEEGELQLTEYGISGIPVFQISRFASVALDDGRQVTVLVDFLPSQSRDESRRFLKSRVERLGYRECGDFLTGVLNKKLALVLLNISGIRKETKVGDVKPYQWDRLFANLKCYEAKVTATNPFEQAQVCCGGADTRDIRPETMESRLVPGLYLTGELLDVDGICGGYNLQWAWSTGMIAGRSAGKA